uniref:Uncharacterized protein n=1 Tax=Anguilla anguilla TaxID=7936 RepID=A0A0E9PA20_ANGAN
MLPCFAGDKKHRDTCDDLICFGQSGGTTSGSWRLRKNKQLL